MEGIVAGSLRPSLAGVSKIMAGEDFHLNLFVREGQMLYQPIPVGYSVVNEPSVLPLVLCALLSRMVLRPRLKGNEPSSLSVEILLVQPNAL